MRRRVTFFLLRGTGLTASLAIRFGRLIRLVLLLTALTAPYGARLAHRLDKRMLRRVFAVYMLATAISVIVKAF